MPTVSYASYKQAVDLLREMDVQVKPKLFNGASLQLLNRGPDSRSHMLDIHSGHGG